MPLDPQKAAPAHLLDVVGSIDRIAPGVVYGIARGHLPTLRAQARTLIDEIQRHSNP